MSKIDRRGFLKGLAALGAAVGIAATSAKPATSAAPEPIKPDVDLAETRKTIIAYQKELDFLQSRMQSAFYQARIFNYVDFYAQDIPVDTVTVKNDIVHWSGKLNVAHVNYELAVKQYGEASIQAQRAMQEVTTLAEEERKFYIHGYYTPPAIYSIGVDES